MYIYKNSIVLINSHMLIAESNYLRQLPHHHLDYCITVAGFIYTIQTPKNDLPGVELPTSPYTSKDKGGLVNLPNN